MRAKSILSLLLLPLCLFLLSAQKHEIKDPPKVELKKVIASECDYGLDPYIFKDRVISKTVTGDSLILSIGLKQNCCMEFNPAIAFKENTLSINLDTSSVKKLACPCNCCYELSFIMTGLTDTNFSVKIGDQLLKTNAHPYPVYPERFDIFEGDTINKYNIYSLKEGVWVYFNKATGLVKQKRFYPGTSTSQAVIWKENYNEQGLKISRIQGDTSWFFNEQEQLDHKIIQYRNSEARYYEWTEKTSFYKNGKVKSICRPKEIKKANFNSILDDCEYWDEEGTRLDNTKK